jgi:hypothetical protein
MRKTEKDWRPDTQKTRGTEHVRPVEVPHNVGTGRTVKQSCVMHVDGLTLPNSQAGGSHSFPRYLQPNKAHNIDV